MKSLGGWMLRSGAMLAFFMCIGGAGAPGARQTRVAVGWYGETMPHGIRQGTVPGEYVHQKDQAIMVYVPAGPFLRGTSTAQAQALTAQFGDYFVVETPQRSIDLSAYYMDKFEVTNQQYARFLAVITRTGRHAAHAKPSYKNHMPTYWHDHRLNGATQPVTGVDWYDASAYCHWAGKRLPTEAQWEKAARGPDGREFPWGNMWDAAYANNVESLFGQPILGERQWIELLGHLYLGALPVLTTPVGHFPHGVSPYRVHDMGGNVWEWCQDSYQKDYYRQAPSRNPPGPPSSAYKVLRGGCWSSHRGKLRTAYRNYDLATDRHLEVGFRCVR
jgi:formylglycine-generating enzyme required for sulfatase activity